MPDLRNEDAPTPTAQWRQFHNYMQVQDFQDRRPEVARSRMTAYEYKHRGKVHTKSPRPVNRASRRARTHDEDGQRTRKEQRGTHTADLGTWAAEQRTSRVQDNAERRAFKGSVLA